MNNNERRKHDIHMIIEKIKKSNIVLLNTSMYFNEGPGVYIVHRNSLEFSDLNVSYLPISRINKVYPLLSLNIPTHYNPYLNMIICVIYKSDISNHFDIYTTMIYLDCFLVSKL